MSRRLPVYHSEQFASDLARARQDHPEVDDSLARGPAWVLSRPGQAELYYSAPGFEGCLGYPFHVKPGTSYLVVYRVTAEILFERLVPIPAPPGFRPLGRFL